MPPLTVERQIFSDADKDDPQVHEWSARLLAGARCKGQSVSALVRKAPHITKLPLKVSDSGRFGLNAPTPTGNVRDVHGDKCLLHR